MTGRTCVHVLLVSSFFFGMCTRAHSVGVGVCKSEDTFLSSALQGKDLHLLDPLVCFGGGVVIFALFLRRGLSVALAVLGICWCRVMGMCPSWSPVENQ